MLIFMVERVETGGMMSFEYNKDSGKKLSKEEKEEFNRAYQRAEERKEREKRNNLVILIIIILIIISFGIWYFLS